MLAARLGWVAVIVAGLGLGSARAYAGEMKLEALLVWGTNDAKSPNPKHKPVEAEVAKKLQALPFKWKNYFEVKRERFTLAEGETKDVTMSKVCVIKVVKLGDEKLEVSVFGKGKQVSKITQALPKNDMIVTGGDAENLTAWFVVLRQVD